MASINWSISILLSVSVGSIAVDLAGKIFGDLTKCKVLLLGAGETSERTARALVARGVEPVRIHTEIFGSGMLD